MSGMPLCTAADRRLKRGMWREIGGGFVGRPGPRSMIQDPVSVSVSYRQTAR